MRVSGRRWFAIVLAALMALPAVGLQAVLTATAAGAGVTTYSVVGISEPIKVATGPDNNLWFTNYGGNSIGRITPAGVVTTFSHPSIDNPFGITADNADGSLWFTNSGSGADGSIGRISTTGTITNFTDPGIHTPDSIALGTDGALWFANYDDNSIGRITTAGAVTYFTNPSVSEPYAITPGPDGALWFTNLGTNSIGRISISGTITNYTNLSISTPYDITTGPDGALWFTDFSSDSIGRITTTGVVSNYPDSGVVAPFSITTGPDGALWFTDLSDGSIGRVTTAGVFTKYTDPSISDPYGITSGPDGALWFGNLTLDTIGRITTDTPASCGTGCVTTVADPGATVASSSGPPTDAHPTKQTMTLPDLAGAEPVKVILRSITPSAHASAADKQLCPTSGSATRCSGQISVFAGNFKQYVSRAQPIAIQVISKWKTRVPAGRMLFGQDTGGPPIQLAACAKENGLYNTPCAKPEVRTGSAANHNLITKDTILFVGNDPHVARRVSNTPDAPTAVKATAGTKQAVVTWKRPVVTNGTLKGYLITPHAGRASLTPVSAGAAATKATIKNLKSGQSYTFTVAAKNAHGLSYQSIASKPVKPK